MDQNEWLKARALGIGGSDIGAIFGLSSYSTPRQIWESKTGARVSEETEDTQRGHELEDYVAKSLSRQASLKVVVPEKAIFVDSEHDHFRASIDRLFIDASGKVGVLECKTTRLRLDPNTLPKTWLHQVQWYMSVGGFDKAIIAWLGPYYDIEWVEVQRDEELIAMQRQKAHEFWTNHVLTGTPPPPATASEIAAAYPKQTDGKVVKATVEMMKKVTELGAVSDQIKTLEKHKEDLSNEVKKFIEDGESLVYANGTIATYKKNKDSEQIDSEKLKKEMPAIWEKYKVAKPGARILRLK